MIQEVKYAGFSANPSDYEANDGDLAVAINAVPEDGTIKAIKQPEKIQEGKKGERVVFLHTLPNGKVNEIRQRTLTDKDTGEQHEQLFMLRDDSVDFVFVLHNFESNITIEEITAVKTILVVLASDGLYYFRYAPGESLFSDYVYLGNGIPHCDMQFGLSFYKDGLYTETIPFGRDANQYRYMSDEKKKEFTSIAKAKANTFINNVHEEGKFIFPFFVRYAYRLYDGSLAKFSPPILMECNMRTPLFLYWYLVDGAIKDLTIASNVAYLECGVKTQEQIDDIRVWTDLIQSVDVFVSRPIYYYDQGGDYLSPTEDYAYTKQYSVGHLGNTTYGIYAKHQAWTYLELKDGNVVQGHHLGQTDGTLPRVSINDYLDSFKKCADFYYLASIELDNLRTELIRIENIGNLNTLATREAARDAGEPLDILMPHTSFVYNGRLNLANVSKVLFKGFAPEIVRGFENGFYNGVYNNVQGDTSTISRGVVNADFYVHLHGLYGTKILRRSGQIAKGSILWGSSPPLFEFRWFFYPDVNAKQVDVVVDGQVYSFKLTQHDFLNGTYYFNPDGTLPAPTTTIPKETNTTVSIENNQICVSEVDNPFLFPAKNTVSVGNGAVLGLSTAVKALSQGQFGQFPLYCFTTEGVWALEVSDTGVYSARQPITRDVCNNPDSITQLDGAVLFTTDRGIMLLSGSETTCISDNLDTDIPFTLDSVPKGKELFNMTGLNAEDYNIIPFKDFIRTCKILYDYPTQKIIVYNPTLDDDGTVKHRYAYVYSLKSKQWGMMSSNIVDTLNSYPDTLVVDETNSIYTFVPQRDEDGSFTDEYNKPVKGLLITRPMKFDGPDILKTVDTLIQRGQFHKGAVKTVLYGSRDLYNWHVVGSSVDHTLRGIHGTPYKYFRVAAVFELNADEGIEGCSVSFTPRYTNKLR